jgi:hypothetical protein
MVGAVGVVGAASQARVIGARATRAGHAFLRLRTGGIETGREALSVNADARIATLEVELAAQGRRVGLLFERIETKTVVRAGRSDGAFVLFLALACTAERGAHFSQGAVNVRRTKVSLRRRLPVALVSTAQEAAAVAERPVGDAEVARIAIAGGEPGYRDDENPEAFHGRFDASTQSIFTAGLA